MRPRYAVNNIFIARKIDLYNIIKLLYDEKRGYGYEPLRPAGCEAVYRTGHTH
jgi:hypothetical protein